MLNIIKKSVLIILVSIIPFIATVNAENTDAPDKSYEQGLKHYNNKEYTKAFSLLYEAAKKGNADAQMHVAKMYFNGWGVKHDHDKAKIWHQKAADQGNEESIKKLKKFHH